MYSYIHSHMFIAMIICSIFTEPEPPADILVAIVDSDTAMVSWTASQSRICDAVISNYIVKYQLRNGTGGYITFYTSSTSVTLNRLTPCNTEYSVSVATIYPNGDMSAFSAVRNFHTDLPKVTPGETSCCYQWSDHCR